MKWLIAFSLLIVSTHMACGHRWREAESGRSAEEVGQMLEQLQSSSSGTSSELQKAIDLIDQFPETAVYFAEAPGALGPIHAVLPIDTNSLLGEQINFSDLTEIRAFFLDLSTDEGHENILIFEYKINGSSASNYKVFTNDGTLPKGEVVDGEFTVTLKSGSEYIVIRSFDVDEELNELNPVIQVELSGIDAQGQESGNFGQISSMEGFSIFF